MSKTSSRRAAFDILGEQVAPGTRAMLQMDIGKLYTNTPLSIGVEVIHGKHDGPVLLVTAAIHGDELNGIEVCRRLAKLPALDRLHGTLVLVPIVNAFGFIQQIRYLPDRRDLNRCFPGSEKGSLGSRIAYLIRKELLEKCTHVVDLHTGAIHRSNLPQIRANLEDDANVAMAQAFGAPVVMHSNVLDGSFREAADKLGKPFILYEAGQALRFDEPSINGGVKGVLGVMDHLGMLKSRRRSKKSIEPIVASSSQWVRAAHDGMMVAKTELGERVKKDDLLALIVDPYGEMELEVRTPVNGIVIGRNNIPVVNEGEALFHVAKFDTVREAAKTVEQFHEHMEDLNDPDLRHTDPWGERYDS
ncbi:succinylglutamate desuccinylase/aspartoacylase family protein [Simiduia sp. 21SJ11W-1]|uniref:succinylglutamate desuccinylase/aspartoacylase family protein n=1 Tax=Simiduia sp. 21SJ11W-1 TaxID=2909669 RepID=UPI00209F8821|nr:succinylglutamate desuccinylase/aspartoacylase family protein [Simiduia sp. 21SJ11W-1]UTA47687.1 succinylglutamate desuccinylase/aspartoacylase family protein [Simiduia sp. 21SJ11W-1]